MTNEIRPVASVKLVTVPASTTVVDGEIVNLDGFIGVADLSTIGAATLTTGAGETKQIPINIDDRVERRTDQIDGTAMATLGMALYWDAVAKKLTATVAQNEKVAKLTGIKADGMIEFMFLRGTTSVQLEKVEGYLKNRVVDGMIVKALAESTHADGSTFNFDADISEGSVIVDGVLKTFALQDAFDVAHGATSPIVHASTKEIIYAIVAKNAAGTISLVSVAGAAAANDAAVAPTDAQIATAVSDVPFVRIGNYKLATASASTVGETAYNDVKPVYVA